MNWKEVMVVFSIAFTVNIFMSNASPYAPLPPGQLRFIQDAQCENIFMMCEFLFPYNSYYKDSCKKRCHFYDLRDPPGNQRRTPANGPVMIPKNDGKRKEVERIYPNRTADGRQVFEGDMVLSEKQFRNIYTKEGRKARDNEEAFWPGGVIPFTILDSSLEDKEAILGAITHWMEQTCLKFLEVPSESSVHKLIFQKQDGCYSSVGREESFGELTTSPGQPISIGVGCEDVGTIVHEIGHTIGFYHEHARPDRDQHVKILYDNVKDYHLPNFKVASINTFGIPYDLASVMHYKAKEFSKNGKNTVVPLNPLRHFQIGQRKKLSFLDRKMANVIYKCNAHCPSTDHCFNEGFVDKACVCNCPEDFEGERCENPRRSPDIPCGGIVTSSMIITTPSYPKQTAEIVKCIWAIQAPEKQSIKIYFEDFDINTNTDCKKEGLEIRKGENYDGEFYCGNTLQKTTITLKMPLVFLFYVSETKDVRGFKASVQFEYTSGEQHEEPNPYGFFQ